MDTQICPRCHFGPIDCYDDVGTILVCMSCRLYYRKATGKWLTDLARQNGPDPVKDLVPDIEYVPGPTHDCPKKALAEDGYQGLPYFSGGRCRFVMGVSYMEYTIDLWFCPYCGEKLS